MSTPSEKPVSKRRTPPAWPAYHGENPTCAHRQIEAHNFFAQMRIGNRIHYTTETMWCLGPVIATEPETPVTEDATVVTRCERCGRSATYCACGKDAKFYEALPLDKTLPNARLAHMVRVMVGHTEHVFNEGKSIVRHAISEHRNCDLCPQIPVSDPSPELRERIANAIFKGDFANVDWERHDHKDAYYRNADAVLVVLGEPK